MSVLGTTKHSLCNCIDTWQYSCVVLYCIRFPLGVFSPSCLPPVADVTSLFPVSAAVTNQSAGAP